MSEEKKISEELEKRFEGYRDKDIAKSAIKLKIELTDKMERNDVILAIVEKEDELKKEKEAKKTAPKVKGKILIEFSGVGTIHDKGILWKGKRRTRLPEKEAMDLLIRFPQKFKIII